jgi:glutamate formiminotransferase / 5-formyltetrahydrofolate cyclo-ligase
MSKILAVVPNISEGTDEQFIEDLTARLGEIPGLLMLDVSVDRGRNRTVLSFTGTKEAVFAGGFLLYELTLKQVDMRQHEGDYPRVGAVDVFPFVPLKDATIEEARAWAEEFAQKVVERFNLPVYLFAESARYRYRRDIDNIRAGEYEGFAAKMKDVRWKPDLGPDEFPPDSGVTIIGARDPLISFKVNFSCTEEAVADAIGHLVADTSGGIVRANARVDQETGRAMLTVSVTEIKASPMYRVIEIIRMEARRFGVEIRSVEMIGLIPEIVLLEAAEYYMQIMNFDRADILERSIQAHLDERFLGPGDS